MHSGDLVDAAPQVEIKGSPDIYVNSGSQVELLCLLTDVLEEPPFIFWHYEDERLLIDNADSGQIPQDVHPEAMEVAAPQAWVAEQEGASVAAVASFHPEELWHPEEMEEETGEEMEGEAEEAPEEAEDSYQFNTDSTQGSLMEGGTTARGQVHPHPHRKPHPTRKRKPTIRTTSIHRLQPGVILSRLTITNPSMEDSGRYQCRPSNMAIANVTLHVLDGKSR